jgi:peroxiredoxin
MQKLRRGRVNAALILPLLLGLFGVVLAMVMLTQTMPPNLTQTSTAGILPPPGLLDKSAPVFTLSTLDGEVVSLADYRGRVVFVNFWWSGCPPCVEELPTFQQFASEQSTTGAVVLAVNVGEEPAQIQEFLSENDIVMNNVPILLDTNYAVLRKYGVSVFPTTYIVNPDGVLSKVKFGAFNLDELYSYLASVISAST